MPLGEALEGGGPLRLAVLETVMGAQAGHGLRHGDYARYRRHCGSVLAGLRTAVRLTHGRGRRFERRRVAGALRKAGGGGGGGGAGARFGARHLLVLVYAAERAWGHGMELREAGRRRPRARFHARRRFSKAAQHARELWRVVERVHRAGAAEGVEGVDARLLVEARAYADFHEGTARAERRQWAAAAGLFGRVKAAYGALAAVGMPAERDLCRGRVAEVEPIVRFCAYNLNKEATSRGRGGGREGPQPQSVLPQGDEGLAALGPRERARVEAVVAAARAREGEDTATEFAWRGGQRVNLLACEDAAAFRHLQAALRTEAALQASAFVPGLSPAAPAAAASSSSRGKASGRSQRGEHWTCASAVASERCYDVALGHFAEAAVAVGEALRKAVIVDRSSGEGGAGGDREGRGGSAQTEALRLLQRWVAHRMGQHRLAREVGRLCAAAGAVGPHEDQVVHTRRCHAGPRECLRRCGRLRRMAAALGEFETSREMLAVVGVASEGHAVAAQLAALEELVGAWEVRFRGIAAAQVRQHEAAAALLHEAKAKAGALAASAGQGWAGALGGAAGEAQLGAWVEALGPGTLSVECAALEVALQARRLAAVRVNSKAKNAARRLSRKRARTERQGLPSSAGGSGYATAQDTDEDEVGSGDDADDRRRPGTSAVGFTGLAQSVRALGSSLWGARKQ